MKIVVKEWYAIEALLFLDHVKVINIILLDQEQTGYIMLKGGNALAINKDIGQLDG